MLQAGFASSDITPDVGMEMPGGFFKATGKGVRDRLIAAACVLHDGTTPVALVGIDALFIDRSTVDAARRLIQAATRIPGSNVLIGANHTHTGGPMIRAAVDGGDPVYAGRVAKAIAEAVTTASQKLHAVEVGIATGHEGSISFNRRFLMRDGREITHPGKPGTPHHKEIVAPAGPIDPDVGVLAFRNPNGKVAGVFVNFACHSTVVGGDQFSPDYAGYLRKHLKAHYGEDTAVGFLLGACGDITQVDNMSTAREYGPEYADMMGRKLAAESVRVIGRAAWLKEAPLAVTNETVALPYRSETDFEAERPPFGLGSGEKVDEVYRKSREQLAEIRRKTPFVPAEVQAIRVGPLGIVTNGAEYFCEYALRIKRCSPFETTWFISLANEWLGYVATAQAFMGGGYEVRTGRGSRLAVHAGQKLLETSLKALGKVAPKAK